MQTFSRTIGRRAALSVLAGLAAGAAVAASAFAAAPQRAEHPVPRPGSAAAVAAAPSAADHAAAAKLSGRVGFALIDVETGERLETLRAEEPFPPASVAKLVTALYALETLGPEHRFETRLDVSGEIDAEGALKGALTLVGGGDPDLDTDALAELAAQASARGLRRVDGPFRVDAGPGPEIAAIDPEQPEDAAYNPAVSALNLNYNRVLLSWSRGEGGALSLAMQAQGRRWAPESGAVTVAVSKSPAAVLARSDAPAAEGWTVMETALDREGKRWLPVRRPAAYAGDAFRSVAAEHGLALGPPEAGRTPDGATTIAFRRSAPLEEIAREMLRWSTNLTAEAVGLAATRARGWPADDLAASGAAMSRWAEARAGLKASGGAGPSLAAVALGGASPGGGATGIDLRNHSGLSADSASSPAQMTALLRAGSVGPRNGFGRGGPGLLESVLRPLKLDPARGEAPLPPGVSGVAKTGTLNFVRGLAGYVTAASGRKLAFAIFSEDLERRARLEDGRPGGGSRNWLGRAREMERRMVRGWAAAY